MNADQILEMAPDKKISFVIAATVAAMAAEGGASAAPAEELKTPDWNDERVQKYRASLVRKIWEPGLRRDLVDLIVRIRCTGWCSEKELQRVIRKAEEAVEDYRRGMPSGRQARWMTLGAWVRGKLATHGNEWRRTNCALEPEPERPLFNPPRAADQNNDDDKKLTPEEMHESIQKGLEDLKKRRAARSAKENETDENETAPGGDC